LHYPLERKEVSEVAKVFACKDIMPDCDWSASAETEEELMKKIAAHGKESHGITEITPDMAEKVKQAIKDQ
jgi:predicted small metal-binding protein